MHVVNSMDDVILKMVGFSHVKAIVDMRMKA